jgi:hypothetical protein
MKLPVKYNELTWQEKRDVRNEYIKLQSNLCFYCNKELSGNPPDTVTNKRINWKLFPPNFLKYPIHLQHCHKTGLTEGAVHAYCNAVLWQYHGR